MADASLDGSDSGDPGSADRSRPAGARLARYLAEFVVIFLGVSLSFVAENVREARADRASERAALTRLLQDMESDLADFPGNADRALLGIRSIDWITTPREGTMPAMDSLEHHLGNVLVCSHMMDNTSEYQSLKGSGNLRLIRDSEFRRALTANYEAYPLLADLHWIDCEHQQVPFESVADHIRIRPDRSVEVVGDAEQILGNGPFLLALSALRGRRGAIVANSRERIEALESLRDRARQLLDSD